MKKFSKTIYLIILLGIFVVAAGFFTYQRQQIKRQLQAQIEQNKNSTNQINELSQEIKRLEATDWKTYTTEEYGVKFEMDLPTVGWEFKDHSLCRTNEEDEKKLCITIGVVFLQSECYGLSWYEIFASGEFTGTKRVCLEGHPYGGNFQEKILTTSGIKGYKGKMTFPLKENCTEETVVYFLLEKRIKREQWDYFPLVTFSYFDCPKSFNFGQKEIEVFDKIISSFRFI